MTTVFQTLGLDLDERSVATLTLNRPDKHNALNDVLIRELREAADRIALDDDIRAVVLTRVRYFLERSQAPWRSRN